MGGKTQTTTQQQTNTPAGLAQLGDIWNRVQQVASTPYQPYTGQLVAGLTPTQQQGIQGVTNAQGAAQPYFDQAAQYATQGASTIDPSNIQKYMNPYTQNVIDATKANFQQDNAIGQQQVLGNAASRGALGGDRVGVAQSELARQQGLAQNPVIAGLQQQNYSQALGAAQQDRSAAAQGAYTFGALAPSVQNAQISGAQAQIGAGGLEQGTNQAGLTAAYNQYLQAQAFPYQQAGFLSSAGLPAVGAMGGSSAGSTTSPGPNPWAQIAGLGVGAAAAFSDERVKDDIQKVGKTFDGQNIYSFKFKGSPQTHMGLIAQEVEKKHPEAVGEVGGIKTVNYEDALPHKADGGPIGFNDVQTYIPKFGGMGGGGGNPYASTPTLSPARSVAQDPFAGLSPMGAMSAGKSAGKGLGGLFGGNDPTATTGFTGNTGEAFPGISDATTSYMGGVSYPMFGDGGSVGPSGRVRTIPIIRDGAHLNRLINSAEGDDDLSAIRKQAEKQGLAISAIPALRYADGGIVSPNDYVRQGFGDTQDAMDSGAFDPQGANALGPMAFQPPSVPLPRPRPDDAPDQLPAEAQLTAGNAQSPMAMSGGQPVIGPDGGIMPPGAAGASPYAMPGPNGMPAPVNDSPSGSAPEVKTGMGGWNPLNLSDDARMGLLAAGLGVAASKSPFSLSAIGEGGLQGVKTYADQKKQREKAESEARKLAQQASQFAQNLGLHKDTLAETVRHNTESERRADSAEKRALIPSGYRAASDGSLEAIPGGPADTATVKANAEAKIAEGGLLDPDTIKFMAQQYRAGDTSTLTNLGRGAQGAQNIVLLRKEIQKQNAGEGLGGADQAVRNAEFMGTKAGQRTLGTKQANIELAATEFKNVLPVVQQASKAVDRTNYPDLNKVIQSWQEKTGDPKIVAFGGGVNTLINLYARAISPSGVATVSDKDHAREILTKSWSQGQFDAAVGMMQKEIDAALQSPEKVRDEMRKRFIGGQGAGTSAAPAQPAANPADKQALDWASANPTDPRAMAIKKRLGVP
jgi:hypothetical protein